MQVLLIVAVMTLHSFSEGIGIGVSFGGNVSARAAARRPRDGRRAAPVLTGAPLRTCRAQAATPLGMLVTTTLAVHNVPEGFAVSMVLCAKGMSVWGASLWSITTSIPQPIMALLAFRCVDAFVPVQPIGLGFAAGAMLWVAWFELFAEAHEACGLAMTSAVGMASATVMALTHAFLL